MKALSESSWRDLTVIFVLTVVVIVAVNAIFGDELLSSTTAAAIPIAIVGLVLLIAYSKRRHPRG